MNLLSQNDDVYNEIRALSLFSNCSDDFVRVLSRQSQMTSLEKGQVLFLQEDEIEHFFVVKQGWVKLFRETLDGTQAVIDIVTKGDVFGKSALFQNNRAPYSAEAVENSKVISLPLSFLKREIEANSQMALSMLASMAQDRQQQDKELEHRTIQNAPQRIGCFLLRLANQEEEGGVSIHLPYDKTLLASRLGMQPETFSRALKKLKNETGIEIHGATIKMNSLDQLVKYCCAACSSEFPCKDLAQAS